jgi:hypothetical protein
MRRIRTDHRKDRKARRHGEQGPQNAWVNCFNGTNDGPHQEAGAATGSSASTLLATARLTRMPAIVAVPKSARAVMPCSHPSPATEWEKRPTATWSTVTPSTIGAHLMPPGTLAKNELIKNSSEIAGRTKMPPVACHEKSRVATQRGREFCGLIQGAATLNPLD